MALSIAQKLRINEGMTLLPVNAPDDFEKHLGKLPAKTKIIPKSTDYDQIHWFVKNRAEMEKQVEKIIKMLKPGTLCWIYYPKGSSGIQTDLTRDKGWESLLKHSELQWVNLISFDDTWSSFAMRLKAEADEKKETKSRERPIFDYVDPVAKTVRLPDDLAKALKKSKTALSFFDSLSFTNKKEYVEWIVTAKREETRLERVLGTIGRLEKKWKNPRNI
ncbi:MAG TPA: YdeI/OmpD-associated family protein [Puia sp.]|nr:YdeI/OmpD-associated family protein [Puia sp.]